MEQNPILQNQQQDKRILAMSAIKTQVMRARAYHNQKLKNDYNEKVKKREPFFTHISKYLVHSNWVTPLLKILLFLLIFGATLRGVSIYYYQIVDWFAVFGFFTLCYISSKREKLISAVFFGFCSFIFFTGLTRFLQDYLFQHSMWLMVDAMACTILIICTVYDTAIKIMKEDHNKDHNKEIETLMEQKETLYKLLKK